MLLSRIKWKLLHLKDSIEEKLNIRHKLEPPSRLAKINIGNNRKIAQEFFSYFIKYLNITKDSHILEVGSGFGRMAIPLTTFLDKNGSYDGIELIEDGVNWCQNKFTSVFPNFKFQQIDVYNSRYNPKGTTSPTQYIFPFKDNSFSAIYLTSVFTHMYPKAIENYLIQIGRVLKPGAKCLCTYYLYDNHFENEVNNDGLYTFKFEFENYRLEDIEKPLYQIAVKESYLRELYTKAGLKISEPIKYGSWSGKRSEFSFQDIIVAEKKGCNEL